MTEKAFVGQFQQQSALGIAALRHGKAAQTFGQIQKLYKQDIDPAVGGEGPGLRQDIAGAGRFMETGRRLLFSIYDGISGG